ncbi:hypothetical protein HY346_01845 [Candidatus Microgenomates bacterium]|nr:hypothetical protein [Candidatus Microgenomates bacterium]
MRNKRLRHWEPSATTPGYRPVQQPTKPRGRKFSTRWLLAGLGVVFAVGALVLAGTVRQVEVEGSSQPETIRQTAQQLLADSWLGWHLLGVDSAAFAERLATAKVDTVAAVSVQRNWLSGRLVIKVEERAPALRWQTHGQVYAVDQLGVVTQEGSGQPKGRLPLVIDATNLPVVVGQTVAPPTFVSFVQELTAKMTAIIKLTYQRGRVLDTTNELYVDTPAGWYIRFDTTRSATEQLGAVKSLLDRRVKPADYVDVRLPYKAYYR